MKETTGNTIESFATSGGDVSEEGQRYTTISSDIGGVSNEDATATTPGAVRVAGPDYRGEDSGHIHIDSQNDSHISTPPHNDGGTNFIVQPGAYRVCPRPDHRGGNSDDNNAFTDNQNDSRCISNPPLATHTNQVGELVIHDDDVILEGFVAGPSEDELREAKAAAEAQALLDAAITLDDSAVIPIPDEDDRAHEEEAQHQQDQETGGVTKQESGDAVIGLPDGDAMSTDKTGKKAKSPLFAPIALTVIFLTSLALAVGLSSSKSSGGPDSSDESSTSTSSVCIENHADRYAYARRMVSEITPLETLDDESTHQNKALTWLVCNDTISANLIDHRDAETGELPKQAHGSIHGGDAGETQVLRRYALATFYFSTTEDGPWIDSWNFINGSCHECGWHKNYTRDAFGSGDGFDPAGVHCKIPVVEYSYFQQIPLILDDYQWPIGDMYFNIRVFNNLTGSIPPEWGYAVDITNVGIESQGPGLRGSIPDTVGNMKHLTAFSIYFGGPDFGGMIPPSLFNIPALEFLNIQLSEGIWELPHDINPGFQSKMKVMGLQQCGLTGMIPSFVSKITSIEKLDFAGNSWEGTIPESWGDLKNVTYLNLHGNNMTGALPESLGQLASMEALVLGMNNFEGTIPSTLGNLGKLRLLDLSHNNLEGGVPASFSQLSSLGQISLQHNKHLNGTIAAFESLKQLESLLLYNNSFTGSIPPRLFSNLANSSEYTIFADFGHNKFTGKLPDAFSQYAKNTSYLSLMENSLDPDAVQNITCEEVPVLFADCKSCPCCKTCCSEDSADLCQFDVNFYEIAGLNCGPWWWTCRTISYDPVPVEDNDSEPL